MQLDRTDWLLVRELYGWRAGDHPSGPLRVSPTMLAEATGVHPKTVRERLAALRKAEVIDGPYLEVADPRVLGHHVSGHMLEGLRPRDPEALERALATVPSVQFAVFASGFCYVVFWHEEPASPPRLLADIQRALGSTGQWPSFSSVHFPPRPASACSKVDGRLALALRQRPPRSLKQAARHAGVTPRTAERRLKALVGAGAATMQTRFRPGRMTGALYVHYVVHDGDDRAAATLAKAFPDRIVGPFGPATRPNVGVAVASLEAAERRREESERLPGIRSLGLYVVRDWIYPRAFDGWLADVVAKRTSAVR